MGYRPQFQISPALLTRVEAIAILRERIQGAAVQVSWIPALQKDSRIRNAHSSTAIEGNPLTLEQVRAVEEGATLPVPGRIRREVVNYFAALWHIEREPDTKRLTHEDIFRLHRIVAGAVMDQGEAGSYRTVMVRVGEFLPPVPEVVSGLMSELLEWWNPSPCRFRRCSARQLCTTALRRFTRLPTATGAPAGRWPSGIFIGEASTRIIFSPWMSSIGRIVRAITPRSRR